MSCFEVWIKVSDLVGAVIFNDLFIRSAHLNHMRADFYYVENRPFKGSVVTYTFNRIHATCSARVAFKTILVHLCEEIKFDVIATIHTVK